MGNEALQALQERLEAADTPQQAAGILKEEGIHITEQDLTSLTGAGNGELSEGALEMVVGGSDFSGSVFYALKQMLDKQKGSRRGA